jgi:hypothetical protein
MPRSGALLLNESRLNHFSKLLFQSVWWHRLLPAWEVPDASATMPRAGQTPATSTEE